MQYFLYTSYSRESKKLQILIFNNFCLKKNFVQRIFKALFVKKPNYAIRTEATPFGWSKKSLRQKLRIVICNNFCLKKILVQCLFKALFAQKPNWPLRAEVTPVGRFCSYAIPTEIFII